MSSLINNKLINTVLKKLIIPELRVLALTKTHVGAGDEILQKGNALISPWRPYVMCVRDPNNGKSCVNGSNIVALRFGDHGKKNKCVE